jgi:NADH pyrophosphatase NudC (nudix superfamily)
MTDQDPHNEGISLKDVRQVFREENEKLFAKNQPKEKEHNVQSHQKFCSDCGDKNPNFDNKFRWCEDCEIENPSNAKVCSNCGTSDLHEPEEYEED